MSEVARCLCGHAAPFHSRNYEGTEECSYSHGIDARGVDVKCRCSGFVTSMRAPICACGHNGQNHVTAGRHAETRLGKCSFCPCPEYRFMPPMSVSDFCMGVDAAEGDLFIVVVGMLNDPDDPDNMVIANTVGGKLEYAATYIAGDFQAKASHIFIQTSDGVYRTIGGRKQVYTGGLVAERVLLEQALSLRDRLAE